MFAKHHLQSKTSTRQILSGTFPHISPKTTTLEFTVIDTTYIPY